MLETTFIIVFRKEYHSVLGSSITSAKNGLILKGPVHISSGFGAGNWTGPNHTVADERSTLFQINDAIGVGQQSNFTTTRNYQSEIQIDRKKYFFAVIYRSPSQDQSEFDNFTMNFELLLSKIHLPHVSIAPPHPKWRPKM